MVRTKADAAVRVAAGAKAPKKSSSRSQTSPSSPTEKLGKDNLPVNRYCPRETPTWQKKITCFVNRNSTNDEPNKPKESDKAVVGKISGQTKRLSSQLDEDDDMDEDAVQVNKKKLKTNHAMDIDDGTNNLNDSNEEEVNGSMEMDE